MHSVRIAPTFQIRKTIATVHALRTERKAIGGGSRVCPRSEDARLKYDIVLANAIAKLTNASISEHSREGDALEEKFCRKFQ
jgi:hypothetical protein